MAGGRGVWDQPAGHPAEPIMMGGEVKLRELVYVELINERVRGLLELALELLQKDVEHWHAHYTGRE